MYHFESDNVRAFTHRNGKDMDVYITTGIEMKSKSLPEQATTSYSDDKLRSVNIMQKKDKEGNLFASLVF